MRITRTTKKNVRTAKIRGQVHQTVSSNIIKIAARTRKVTIDNIALLITKVSRIEFKEYSKVN